MLQSRRKRGACPVFENPPDDTIKKILSDAKTIAVVGLSDKPDRASHAVAKYLQDAHYRIIPVNPSVSHVLGEPSRASLADIEEDVDVIDIFRRSDALPGIMKEASKLKAPVIWAQLGIFNEEAAAEAKKTGKTVVMDRCIKIEHHRLGL